MAAYCSPWRCEQSRRCTETGPGNDRKVWKIRLRGNIYSFILQFQPAKILKLLGIFFYIPKVNIVGGKRMGNIETCSWEDLDECLTLSVRTTFIVSKVAIPHLIESKGICA